MLVLTRKLNQEIQIGDNVKITVLKVKGNTVRLGIEAPRNIRVVRGELEAHDEPASAPEMADITVVLDRNQPPTSEDRPEIVPFPRRELTDEEEATLSVEYRGPVPSALQHNRLQQIVQALRTDREHV